LPDSLAPQRLARIDDISILRAQKRGDIEAVRGLFLEYAASLTTDLGYQDFASELAALPGAYRPPGGSLLLATRKPGRALGCVALRPLRPQQRCEMKRLYVSPEARGHGLGKALAECAMSEAKKLGYREIYLDTLPAMEQAIAMYRSLGFAPIEPYYAPTPEGTIFLAKLL